MLQVYLLVKTWFVKVKSFPSHLYAIHFTHYLCLISIFRCVLFLHGCRVPSLNSIFVFALLLPPLPHSHPHCDEQTVKVKRKKSFNLSRKFPFYKSKENIVQDLVESEREYPLCDCFFFCFVFF